MTARERAALIPVLAAFTAVYLIWGSTYLAIRISIETLPPFGMAAVRFVLAGAVLYIWARGRGAPRPSGAEWRAAAIIGGMLLVGGNGLVVWAEQTVPSGIAALIIASVPLFMVSFDWLLGNRPAPAVIVGLILGSFGVAVLVAPSEIGAGATVPFDPAGVVALLIASISWSIGSLYAKRAPTPASPLLGIGMQMLLGGLLMGLVSFGRGEGVTLADVSMRSLGALGYLTVFGAIVAYSAYVWLLRAVSTAKVVTYAFVNPVVAVALGWWLAGEVVSARTAVAAAVIVAGVFLITTARPVRRRRGERATERLALPSEAQLDPPPAALEKSTCEA